MFDYTKAETIAGTFLIVGVALLGYLSISIGGFSILPAHRYGVIARFSNVGDLKAGAPIKIAGVTIGKVRVIKLVDYFAEAELALDRAIVLPKDTIASITTAGLLGDAYVALSPGGSDLNLKEGERISHTEPALNVADLVGRFAFGGGKPAGEAEGASPHDGATADAPVVPTKEEAKK